MKMDKTFCRLKSRTDDAESQVKALYEKFNGLDSIRNGLNADKPGEVSPELAALITANTKLKHRLAVLKRAIEEEKQKKPMGMKSNASDSPAMESSMQETLIALFTAAIHTAFPDLPDPPITVVPAQSPFGDYQCNSAMAIAQILKAQGVKMSPWDVGSRIKDAVAPSKLVSKYEVAGPGYVNIWLSRDYGHEVLTRLLIQGVEPPPLLTKHRVLVDFSSPNIAKEMHVGHLRSTIIGESLCRLLEFLGHEVMRINHVGDWGTQFGMLIAHLQDKFPDYLSVSPPIADLQAFYKESKARFDSDEDFKKRAYSCVVKLQAFHPEYTQAWQRICDVSRKEFQKVYDRLNVTLTERGESFYQKHMETLVKDLEQKGFLQEDEGRKVMFGLKEGQIPMTIVKSDGGFTYDTSDLAAIKYRIEQDKADWIIYVTDAGQAVHFQVLMSCAERAGILDPKKVRVDHVGFGVVRGEDKKKFKTRSGETVRLTDLLDEGLKRALDTLKAKNRHEVLTSEELKAAQEAVAYGCIKYADLVHHRNSDYIFSFDKMLEDKGNTAVYMLYMYTRIASIARNANMADAQQLQEAARTVPLSLDHEKEWKLATLLLRFNDALALTSRDLSLHHLCEYLFDVACAFSEFYDKCYCIERDSANGEIKKIHVGRILLCEATKLVMAKVFHILSLDAVNRM